MYYRRKIMLGLLEVFDGRLNKTDFQKLLMILSKHQDKPSYEFVPYKYGCFSFQSYADMRTMIKYNQIGEEDSKDEEQQTFWIKLDKDKYLNTLKKKDQALIRYLKSKFSNYTTTELIRYTYKKYPYYAINSNIAKRILTAEELAEVKKYVPQNNKKALYTIGYEGISQEHYLNKLLKHDIKILCDVRKNPLSMKYGFSKNQLKKACLGLGIEYIHIPDLGIVGSKRKQLKTQCDYDLLFEEYNNSLGDEKPSNAITQILHLLKSNNRIAITCFEADINQCHRKHLAKKIYTKDQDFKVIHI